LFLVLIGHSLPFQFSRGTQRIQIVHIQRREIVREVIIRKYDGQAEV
jgi:hypothetical protein